MDAPDLQKIAELLAELDRLCIDAQEIRRKILELTAARPVWPNLRQVPSPLKEVVPVSDSEPQKAAEQRTDTPRDDEPR